jgi:Flp pilus assembly protein TadD
MAKGVAWPHLLQYVLPTNIAMPSRFLIRFPIVLLILAGLAACTTVPEPAVAPGETSETTPPVSSETTEPTPSEAPAAPAPVSNNPAVVALLDSAHNAATAGQLPSATASLERALRIEPRNPLLWHELAKLKLQKGDYRQAENLAARSNSWAGSNKALRASNWRLISEARSLRGDNAGARAALEKAKSLEQE